MSEPTLQAGDAGDAVTRLQQRLHALRYYDGAVDGCLGERTWAALALLRAHAGAPGEGPVDADTWRLLESVERSVESNDPFVEPWRWEGDRWEHGSADPQAGPVGAAAPSAAADRPSSPDGHWVWDGDRWLPA